MSKYPCDNWSWSLRRCDPKLRDRHDANKENREPISPLSRLAERVDDSRRWAPIPDRWHNHCEWLVNHHRNLRKRFRKTTANDRLAGVLTTLKCTRERRRESDEDESVIGSGSRRKRLRSEVEYPELEPASTWLGSVHPELFQKNSPSPSKVDPFPEEDDEMEVESRKRAREPKGDDGDAEFTKPSGSGESIAERAESSTVTATKGDSRSPSPVDGNFKPEDFRTSTPTTHEKSRREAKESCSTFHRDSAWKDYVMSHDPILFRSYIDTQYPKKSWRYSHQKLAARLGGKYRRSSSGRIRKPPTPKSLRISWNSLDDVVQNEGILRSPLHLLPILPGDATTPLNNINDHSIDVEGLSSNNSHADADVSDVIGDEIRAIRKDCTESHQPADDSYLGSDEREDEGGFDPSELSDISLGEDEKSTDKHGYELDQVSSDDDIDDICRIVDKELIHDDYHPDDILTEISFDILDDLEVDSKYPPNYFRAGFADRAVRRRKMKKATSIINGLDPQARSFRPKYTREEDIADQRIVTFADRETSDQSQDKEQTEDVCGGGGTKFYPSDVRFNKKERLQKDRETPKAMECNNAESEAVITVPIPIPVKKVDPKSEKQKKVKECDSLKSEESEIKEENGGSQQQSPKEETGKAVESEPPVLKTETEHVRDSDKSEKTSTVKPIAKGKAERQVAHKIPVVMGRRPGKPSQIMGNLNRDDGGRSVSRIPTAGGDDDNGCVVPTRIPQLRRVKIRKDEANDEGNVGMEPSGNTCAKETIRTDVDVYDNIVTDPPKNVAIEAKGHMVPTGTENSIQPHSLQPDTSIRNIDMSQSRHAALMKQRLALLKESHGNGPMREAARPMNLPDRVQEQHDPHGTARGSGQKLEMEHRDAEIPDVNNNHFVNSVSQGKISLAPTFANAESNNGIDKGKRISDYAPSDKQSKVSCKKVHQAKENGPENMMNAERAPPLPSEQNEARRSGTNPLSETGRDNHPPQPLFQNPPQRFQHPQHNMNPNMHPSMHPHLHAIPGNAPLYHQHPPDQPRPFNPGLSAYHHHQMALRAAAMHYYSQQRHMALQRHPGIQPPGFFPAHRHPMNMHPGCRPEWNNMPGPGPPH